MNNKKYFSIHTHSIRSIGDAILKIDDLIIKAKQLGLKYLSLTNHGVMSDIFEFYSKCIDNDITPILGCEVYAAKNRLISDSNYSHLILIAKNQEGFENLLQIHNDAHINGFYKKPRTDISILKKYGKGIIALSACVAGSIPKKIIDYYEHPEKEKEHKLAINSIIKEYKDIFDDFFLEIQPGDFIDQINVNNELIKIGLETNTKLIITNDVHYLNQEDYIAHNVHVCSSRKKEVNEDGSICYPDKCYYVMDNNTLYNSLKYIDESIIDSCIDNIYEICESIEDYNLIPNEIHMPQIEIPDGYTNDSYLEYLSFQGLEKIKNKITDISEYTERLLYELDTIKELGFSSYFLVVRDYKLWAESQDIQVGPGRGSICGSLVAYCINIHIVDPIKYNLLFERFISKWRKGSVPD